MEDAVLRSLVDRYANNWEIILEVFRSNRKVSTQFARRGEVAQLMQGTERRGVPTRSMGDSRTMGCHHRSLQEDRCTGPDGKQHEPRGGEGAQCHPVFDATRTDYTEGWDGHTRN